MSDETKTDDIADTIMRAGAMLKAKIQADAYMRGFAAGFIAAQKLSLTIAAEFSGTLTGVDIALKIAELGPKDVTKEHINAGFSPDKAAH
jgi:hypothetical protein